MPTLDENMPLLSAQHPTNFFQKSISAVKNISFKTIGIVSTSAVSVITYFNPAYNAGASVAGGLKEITAGSGLETNFLFNIQAYRELLQQFPSLLKMPWKLSAASSLLRCA